MLGLFLCLLCAWDDNVFNDNIAETFTLELVEDLRFGGDPTVSAYFWADSQTPLLVEADAEGNIYVGDTKDNRILKFDAQGHFLRQIAGPGQGPKEFQHLQGFHIFEDGHSVGYQIDGKTCKYIYYDASGNYQRTDSRMESWNLADIYFSPDDRWRFAFIYKSNTRTGRMSARRVLMNDEMQVVKELSETILPSVNGARFEDPKYWVDQIAGQFRARFESRAIVEFCPDGGILIADASRYRVEKWSPDMKTRLWRMEKKYRPIPLLESEREAFIEHLKDLLFRALPRLHSVITDNVVRRGIERASPPPVKNPIYDLIPMEDGHFLVIHDYRLDTERVVADLFDPSAHYLGRVRLPDRILWDFNTYRCFFKNGHMYVAITADNGENQVVRFRYKIMPL